MLTTADTAGFIVVLFSEDHQRVVANHKIGDFLLFFFVCQFHLNDESFVIVQGLCTHDLKLFQRLSCLPASVESIDGDIVCLDGSMSLTALPRLQRGIECFFCNIF